MSTPDILKKIMEEYGEKVQLDSWSQAFVKRVQENKATAQDASLYARYLGEHASSTLVSNLVTDSLEADPITYELAEGTIQPLLREVWKESNTQAIAVQNIQNKADGIPLKAVPSIYPTNRIEGLVIAVTKANITPLEVQTILTDPVANACQKFYDEFVTTNARKTQSSGTNRATIVRTAESGACKWCRNLAGSWTYGEHPDDVFRRHDNCRCMVTYKSGKYNQDVWSKAIWSDGDSEAKAIADKVQSKNVSDAAQAEQRVTRALSVQKIQQATGYSAKGAAIWYNQNKKYIDQYGLDYMLDYLANTGG